MLSAWKKIKRKGMENLRMMRIKRKGNGEWRMMSKGMENLDKVDSGDFLMR